MKKPGKPRQRSRPPRGGGTAAPENPPESASPPPPPHGETLVLRPKVGNVRLADPRRGGVRVVMKMGIEPGQRLPDGFDPWTHTPKDPHDLKELLSLPPAFAAAQALKAKRERIVSEGPALLEAIATVAKYKLVMPEWIASAYIERFNRIVNLEVGSFDEAFGPLPKELRTNARRANEKQRRELIPKVSRWLVEKLNAEPERAIDKRLFDEAGSAFGIGATKAYELYREGVEKHGMQDIGDMKEVKLFPFKKR